MVLASLWKYGSQNSDGVWVLSVCVGVAVCVCGCGCVCESACVCGWVDMRMWEGGWVCVYESEG